MRNMKAFVVKKFGYFWHWINVTVCWTAGYGMHKARDQFKPSKWTTLEPLEPFEGDHEHWFVTDFEESSLGEESGSHRKVEVIEKNQCLCVHKLIVAEHVNIKL